MKEEKPLPPARRLGASIALGWPRVKYFVPHMQKLIEGVAMAALAAGLRQANVPTWMLGVMFGAWVVYVVAVGPVSALVTSRFRSACGPTGCVG